MAILMRFGDSIETIVQLEMRAFAQENAKQPDYSNEKLHPLILSAVKSALNSMNVAYETQYYLETEFREAVKDFRTDIVIFDYLNDNLIEKLADFITLPTRSNVLRAQKIKLRDLKNKPYEFITSKRKPLLKNAYKIAQIQFENCEIPAIYYASIIDLVLTAFPIIRTTQMLEPYKMMTFRNAVSAFKGKYLEEQLRRSKGDISEAYKRSGISYNSFYHLRQRHCIPANAIADAIKIPETADV